MEPASRITFLTKSSREILIPLLTCRQSRGPPTLKGPEFIGIAHSGTGNTCEYMLLSIVLINAHPFVNRSDAPIVLVLALIRVVPVPIRKECSGLKISSYITNTFVYGGVSKHAQAMDLERGVECNLFPWSSHSFYGV